MPVPALLLPSHAGQAGVVMRARAEPVYRLAVSAVYIDSGTNSASMVRPAKSRPCRLLAASAAAASDSILTYTMPSCGFPERADIYATGVMSIACTMPSGDLGRGPHPALLVERNVQDAALLGALGLHVIADLGVLFQAHPPARAPQHC